MERVWKERKGRSAQSEPEGKAEKETKGPRGYSSLGIFIQKKPSQNHQVLSALHVLIPVSISSPQAGETQC